MGETEGQKVEAVFAFGAAGGGASGRLLESIVLLLLLRSPLMRDIGVLRDRCYF